MNDDYLWDRSGPPDLEVARLERRLAPLRYRHRPLPRPSRVRWALAGALLAAAAGLLLMVTPGVQSTSWLMAGAKLRQGQTVRTGNSAVRLEAEAIGRVDLAANSVLRTTGGKRLSLERGELHAFIWAPAREFVVETPSARAVDLGCEYTLTVDDKGDGVLRVSMGWVAFQVGDREAFIPAGATCVTRRRGGPGIPYFEDAPDGLRRAVERFERGDQGALGGLLAAARPRDGLTLWHLLTRAPEADRGAVFDRFRDLVHLQAGVSRDAVLHRNAQAIDQCWNALDLENTGWWRGWERKWSE
jgi:FecR protein